jgi:8-oxo-dGTP pyrophosphatase MutT (NUDIX family)
MSEPSIVAAIVISDEGVLLGRRHDGKPPWKFIAGAMESGESPQETAARECMEETGLLVAPGEIFGARDHPKTGRHMIYVACRPANGTDVAVGDTSEAPTRDTARWVNCASFARPPQPVLNRR